MTVIIKPSKKILDHLERLKDVSESLKQSNNGKSQTVAL